MAERIYIEQHSVWSVAYLKRSFLATIVRLTPFLTIFFSTWMSVVSFSGIGFVAPDYGLCAVFFWSLYRPNLVSLEALAITGLLMDFFAGGVLGQTALMWFALAVFIIPQRRILARNGFAVTWLAFTLTACLVWLLMILIVWVWKGMTTPPLVLLVHILLTLGVYPILALGLGKIYEKIEPDVLSY